ncbi:MAG: M48 family metalloprotease [Armatimonadota bacterium]|jgi:tetratricopeptide (TPR) repeat protein
MIAAVLSALIVVGTGCSERDVEEALGDISAASIEAAYQIDRDPLISDWIDDRGHTIVSHTRRQNIPYRFSVIETDLVNAFAAPYGHVYVTSGFLNFAETEDEVGMVLAHEVGHIVNRDSIHSFKKSLLFGLAVNIITGESRTAGDIAGIGLGLLSLQYSRDAEYAADDAGTEYSYAVGYDPHQGIEFFHRLASDIEKRRPSRWEVYFMTHPRTEDRVNRQLRRDEFDQKRPESLLRIARGYLQRGQPARAANLLEKGLQLAPELAEAHTLLGDALAMRGDLPEAETAYRTALGLNSRISYAQTRLAALPELPPNTLPGIDSDGRRQAGQLLTELDRARTAAEAARAGAVRYVAQAEPQVASVAGTVRGINERLLNLADTNTEVKKGTRQLVELGNGAVSRAVESAYVLERVTEDLQDSSSEIQSLLAESQAALERAEAGEGNPEDIPALRTAVQELRRAISTVDAAMVEAPKTIQQVESVQSSARDVTSLMELVVRINDPNDLSAEQLKSAAAHTQRRANEALQAVNRAKRQSVQASGHALVARLNLLGSGATPARQRVYDAQVAHFFLVPDAQVRALRSTGAGYGEAALALAASKSISADPGQFIPSLAGGVSPIGAAMERGAAVNNANVLLKYLAASMQAERDAQRAG